MANKYTKRIVVFLEDQAYRDILNGFFMSMNINSNIFEVRNPEGGWSKVFKSFKKQKEVLLKNNCCYILLLMDFDGMYKSRLNDFYNILGKNQKDRAFLFGINNKEAEDLKKYFKISKLNDIGRKLADECPNLSNLNNKHLKDNIKELKRMKSSEIFNLIFEKQI